MLYPLKFKPLYKERIWGGDALARILGKRSLPEGVKVGESWELSDMASGDESVVKEGPLKGNTIGELVEIYMGDLMGESVYERFGDRFPLLIKFIDSQDWLSIQVHPDDQTAIKRHESYGKTEMWYVLDHAPGARLMLGFNRSITPQEYASALAQGEVGSLMSSFEVRKGQSYYIPAGAVHAIGPGILVAEIQQSSDVTYRIFDWNRTDTAGRSRELHTEQAMDVIDFSHHRAEYYLTEPAEQVNGTTTLRHSQFFTTQITTLDGTQELERDYVSLDSFVIYMCVEGRLTIQTDQMDGADHRVSISKGETVLIPAVFNTIILSGKGKVLETYIEARQE